MSLGSPGAAGDSRHESSGSEREQSPTYSARLPNVEAESLSLFRFRGGCEDQTRRGRAQLGTIRASFPPHEHADGAASSGAEVGRRISLLQHACAAVCAGRDGLNSAGFLFFA